MTLREILSDGMILAGSSAIVWAAFQVYPPAAWATGGMFALSYGVLLGRGPS